jgi:hypothetical protein
VLETLLFYFSLFEFSIKANNDNTPPTTTFTPVQERYKASVQVLIELFGSDIDQRPVHADLVRTILLLETRHAILMTTIHFPKDLGANQRTDARLKVRTLHPSVAQGK